MGQNDFFSETARLTNAIGVLVGAELASLPESDAAPLQEILQLCEDILNLLDDYAGKEADADIERVAAELGDDFPTI